MVRRRLTSGPARVLAVVLVMTVAACGTERDMPESVEMADTASIMRALENLAAGDSMMDTLPGGEMVRGDSTELVRLLQDKIDR